MEKSDVRRANLRHIIDQSVARGEAKNDTDFCVQHDLNQSYVSQVLNAKRTIGERSAKNIEEKLNLPAGTLDQATGLPSEQPKNEVRIANVTFGNSGLPNPTSVKIPVYREVKAACGNGNEICLEDVSEYLDIDPKLLKLLGIQTNPDHLKIIFSDEYSMWPTVAPETPLFIDVQENDPSRLRSGKVYVFTHNYHLRMKRVFVNFDGSVRFTSDNPDKNEYPDEVVTAEQAQGINLIGRLVWFGNPA